MSISLLVSQVMVFHFVHFELKKDFWHILVKLIVYRVFFCLAGLIKAILVSNSGYLDTYDILTLVCNGFNLVSRLIKKEA